MQIMSITSRYVSIHFYHRDVIFTSCIQANQAFATRLASVLQPGDLVWVHDYHLLLVPRMLRNAIHTGAVSGVGSENSGDMSVIIHRRGGHTNAPSYVALSVSSYTRLSPALKCSDVYPVGTTPIHSQKMLRKHRRS